MTKLVKTIQVKPAISFTVLAGEDTDRAIDRFFDYLDKFSTLVSYYNNTHNEFYTEEKCESLNVSDTIC